MKEKSGFVALVIFVASLIGALFFGYVSYQMSAFYTDLLRIAADSQISAVNMAKYMMLLDKYQWAWYLPQVVGAVFAVVAAIAGITFVLVSRKTS